jgi:hypothetical protein
MLLATSKGASWVLDLPSWSSGFKCRVFLVLDERIYEPLNREQSDNVAGRRGDIS